MKFQQQYQYCDVCDHRIVPGVACDGQPSECPHQGHGAFGLHGHQGHVPLKALALPGEFDAVRGID